MLVPKTFAQNRTLLWPKMKDGPFFLSSCRCRESAQKQKKYTDVSFLAKRILLNWRVMWPVDPFSRISGKSAASSWGKQAPWMQVGFCKEKKIFFFSFLNGLLCRLFPTRKPFPSHLTSIRLSGVSVLKWRRHVGAFERKLFTSHEHGRPERPASALRSKPCPGRRDVSVGENSPAGFLYFMHTLAFCFLSSFICLSDQEKCVFRRDKVISLLFLVSVI